MNKKTYVYVKRITFKNQLQVKDVFKVVIKTIGLIWNRIYVNYNLLPLIVAKATFFFASWE